MAFYIFQFSLIVASYFVGSKLKVRVYRKGKRRLVDFGVVFSFLIIIFFQAFRSNSVGTDLSGYLDLFHKIQYANTLNELNDNRYGLAFSLITKFISLIDNSDRFFIVFTTLLIQIPIAFIIQKYSKNKLLSICGYVCLGYYFATFCTIRQCLAYSLCFLSFYGVKERKVFIYIILVTLASFIHISAIAFAPVYWIYLFKSKRKYIPIFMIFLLFLLAFKSQLVSLFLQLFSKQFYYYDLETTNSYTWLLICSFIYIASSYFILNTKDKKTSLKGKSIIYYLFKYNPNADSHFDAGLITIFGVGTLISVTALVASNARRVTDFYTYFLILVIAEIPLLFKNKNTQKLVITFSYVFLFIFFISLMSKNSGYGYIPYSFN